MNRPLLRRRLGLTLAAIFAVFTVTEVSTHLGDGPGAYLVWLGMLGGGTLLLLWGLLRPPERPWRAFALVALGSILAGNMTVWTLVLPLALIVFLVLSFQHAKALSPPRADPLSHGGVPGESR